MRTPATTQSGIETARVELRGVPAGRGAVTGHARVLRCPEDAALLQPGDVLVCAMTGPAWTPLLRIAAGVISELGGVLSNPAITAREYRIPVVVAVKDASTRIRDGQIVSIDGATGVVTLHP